MDPNKILEEKYNIKILSDASDSRLIYTDQNGYTHNILRRSVSVLDLDSPKFMVIDSLVAYHNTITLKDTELNIINYNEEELLVHNSITNDDCIVKRPFYKLDIEYLKKKTSKAWNYLQEIKKALNDENEEKNEYPWPYPIKRTHTATYTITCKKHGPFTALVDNLIRGHGCPLCSTFQGWGNKREAFCEKCQNKYKKGTLYIVKIIKHDEVFYKIGITSDRDTYLRFSNLRQDGYQVEEIQLYYGDPGIIFDIEKILHKEFIKYEPKTAFPGHTECFKLVNLDRIKELIGTQLALK